MRVLVGLFAFAFALVPATSGHCQVTRTINFGDHPGAATVEGLGAEVTLQPVKDSGDMIGMSAAIRIPGYQSIIVTEGGGSQAGYDRWVAIGKLSASDPAPSVLLEGFSGGAHCCATLKAVVPTAGRLKVIEFEAIDGDSDKTFPKDIDGDGVADFVRADDRFQYAFASHAGSFSPPMIFNIYKGQLVDVSAQPGFRPLWLSFAKVTRTACADLKNDDRNGACVAYVAAKARLGKYDEAAAEADKLANHKAGTELPEGCTIEANGLECPTDKKIKFYTFRNALRWFLQHTGYIE